MRAHLAGLSLKALARAQKSKRANTRPNWATSPAKTRPMSSAKAQSLVQSKVIVLTYLCIMGSSAKANKVPEWTALCDS